MNKKLLLTFFRRYARYGAILAVCFEWLALFLFFLHAPSEFAKQKAISYFSDIPQTRLIFALCLTAAALSFWLYISQHVIKFFKTPVKIFSISMLNYGALALIPFHPENILSNMLHNILAFFFTTFFILGMFLMAKNNVNKSLRIYSLLTALPATLLFIIMAFLQNQNLFFPFEALVGFLCQIWSVAINIQTLTLKKK